MRKHSCISFVALLRFDTRNKEKTKLHFVYLIGIINIYM